MSKFKLHKSIILCYYELILEYYSSSTTRIIKENLTLYKWEQTTAAEVTSGQPLLSLNGIINKTFTKRVKKVILMTSSFHNLKKGGFQVYLLVELRARDHANKTRGV